MPALPDVPNVARVVLGYAWDEDVHVINRFFQKYAGSPFTDADALAYCNSVHAAWIAHLQTFTTPNVTLEFVEVTDLSSTSGSQVLQPFTTVGTGTPPSVTANTALVIREHIERRYRGGHPRQYLPGMQSTATTDAQTWSPTLVTNIGTAYAAFRAAAGSGLPSGNQPVTDVSVSYYHGYTNHTFPSGRVRPVPTLRGTPIVDPIASFSVNPKMGSQRRRALQST